MGHSGSRRRFIINTAALGGISLLPNAIKGYPPLFSANSPKSSGPSKSIIGGYGKWADELVPEPARLSFLNDRWNDVGSWQKEALSKAKTLVAAPAQGKLPEMRVEKKYRFEDLQIEELSWQLPYGHTTRAILLKPANAKGPLPAILGLHDHGGNKYFGKRKITRTSAQMHPMMETHQKNYYEGAAWANEAARRGYVVLVHDTFTFGSRRVLFEDMAEITWGGAATRDRSDHDPEARENIDIYNSWASEHEHIMSKSLFCSGTTWPGVTLSDDQYALGLLAAREDVDDSRIGCAGLSGGGLRTVYLGGLDHRIKCAVAVGFMTTWADFMLYKAYTHTWMTYTPLLPGYLEFPEILGLRVPLPTMTLNNNADRLFTLTEMKKADKTLQDVFAKAGAADRYKGGFYEGDHKFDKTMQKDAFDWFDRWLK